MGDAAVTTAALDAPPAPGDAAPAGPVGRGRLVLRRLLGAPGALVGLAVVVLLFLLAFVGPYLTHWSYTDVDYTALREPPPAPTGSAPAASARTSTPRPCAGCRSR